MVPDLVQSGQQNGGGINYELSWPLHRSFLGDMMGGVMFNNWVMQAYKNNIVADSELANVAAGTGVYTVDAGGATFITGSSRAGFASLIPFRVASAPASLKASSLESTSW